MATPYTVVGVMPADFRFPQGAGGAAPDIWTPIAEPIQLYRGRHYLFVVARLKDGVSLAQAQAEMDAVAGGIEKELPQFSRGHGANVQPLHGEMVLALPPRAARALRGGRDSCCSSAAATSRTCCSRGPRRGSRRSPCGWRSARDGSASRGSCSPKEGSSPRSAAPAARWSRCGSCRSRGRPRPATSRACRRRTSIRPSSASRSAVSVLTALVFGLVPLAQVARVQVADRLKHGSKGVARPIRQPLRRAIVIVEVALTVIIATGAGLFLQSFNRLLHVDPGFVSSGVTAVDIALPPSRYAGAPSQRAFVDEAVSRIGALPFVTAAAATNLVPQGDGRSGIGVAVEGRPAPAPGDELSAGYRVVTPGYFKTLGIPIVAGRGFTAQDARVAVPLIRWFPQQPLPPGFDDPQAAPVAVINQSMARQFWPGQDPIGRRFTVLFSPPIAVVGIVKDSRNRALAEEAGPEFYLSHAQEPQGKMTLLVQSRTGAGLPAALRAQIWSIDRDLPASNIRTLAEIVDANLSLYRAITSLMGAFAAMALVLMTLGVYAVVSYTTAQRTYEIGVRLALGAQRRDIRRLVVINGVGLDRRRDRDRRRRRLRAGAVRVEHALRDRAVRSAHLRRALDAGAGDDDDRHVGPRPPRPARRSRHRAPQRLSLEPGPGLRLAHPGSGLRWPRGVGQSQTWPHWASSQTWPRGGPPRPDGFGSALRGSFSSRIAAL